MAALKVGDRVRIISRSQSDEDAKSAMYFPHYAGLTGTVQKIYGKDEVSVEVEPESLTKEIRKRHEDVRDQMKTKWLDSLSEEGRGKLTEREKNFLLRYVVLVAMRDLEGANVRAQSIAPESSGVGNSPVVPRKTLAEIDAAEEEELRRRASTS